MGLEHFPSGDRSYTGTMAPVGHMKKNGLALKSHSPVSPWMSLALPEFA